MTFSREVTFKNSFIRARRLNGGKVQRTTIRHFVVLQKILAADFAVPLVSPMGTRLWKPPERAETARRSMLGTLENSA